MQKYAEKQVNLQPLSCWKEGGAHTWDTFFVWKRAAFLEQPMIGSQMVDESEAAPKIHWDEHMTEIWGRLVYNLNDVKTTWELPERLRTAGILPGKASSLQHQCRMNVEAPSTPYAPQMALKELRSKVRPLLRITVEARVTFNKISCLGVGNPKILTD